MSLEAWGDEGDVGPDGYVTEDLYDEMKTALREAIALLQQALRGLHHERVNLHATIEKWLAENTVDGSVP